jgi:hypothetical protein
LAAAAFVFLAGAGFLAAALVAVVFERAGAAAALVFLAGAGLGAVFFFAGAAAAAAARRFARATGSDAGADFTFGAFSDEGALSDAGAFSDEGGFSDAGAFSDDGALDAGDLDDAGDGARDRDDGAASSPLGRASRAGPALPRMAAISLANALVGASMERAS